MNSDSDDPSQTPPSPSTPEPVKKDEGKPTPIPAETRNQKVSSGDVVPPGTQPPLAASEPIHETIGKAPSGLWASSGILKIGRASCRERVCSTV